MKKIIQRVFGSLNLLLTLFLIGVLFIMVNFLSSRRYTRLDMTHNKIGSLSEITKQTLNTIESPVTIIAFYQSSHPLYEMVYDLLTEYKSASSLLDIQFVDPQKDIAKAEQIANNFDVKQLNVVIFSSKNRQKHITPVDLAEFDYPDDTPNAEQTLSQFKGESAFTSAILSVVQDEQHITWFTTGHGEKSIDETGPKGVSQFKSTLEQQNLKVASTTLLAHEVIPDSVKLIIIAGPTRKFVKSELDTLEAYLNKGGALLALLDPLTNSALEPLLYKWGISLVDDIVVDPSRKLPFVSATNLLITDYTDHPAVSRLSTIMTLFPLARSARPSKTEIENVSVFPLALTSALGWGELELADENAEFNEEFDIKGPVTIATASEREKPARTRIIVIGDSDFAMNSQLDNVGNRDLAIGSALWLGAQESRIGISPKLVQNIKLNMTGPQLSWAFPIILFGMPLFFGAFGTIIWFIRRK